MENWIINGELALLRSLDVAAAAERELKLRGVQYHTEQEIVTRQRRTWRRWLPIRTQSSL